MLSKSVKSLLGVFVAAFLLSGSASAAIVPITLTPGGPFALVPGNSYFDSQTVLTKGTGFDFQYDFTAAIPPELQTITEVSTLTILGPIANLRAEWFDTGGSIGFLDVTDGTGALLSPGALLLVQILATGNYFLHITGATLGTGAGFVLGVDVTALPLPPALILFLSALLGLGILGRRRHSSGPGLAA